LDFSHDVDVAAQYGRLRNARAGFTLGFTSGRCIVCVSGERNARQRERGRATMTWTTPTLVEICIGLEINGYLPAEI
jgi:coenzyme PQQ precursor peptide PqqA